MDKTKRLNILGGEWIYYKIYLGSKSADNFLSDQIKELVHSLNANGLIEKWFFIRYSDPHPHLRIRYKCNMANLPAVINKMYETLMPLVDNHTIWKVQTDTYNKELERYGIATMDLVETIFCHDSEMIVNFLYHYKNDDEKRWLFAIKAIDYHLDLFNYSLVQKRDLMQGLSIAFKSEFSGSKSLNTSLNNKFRYNKDKINTVLNDFNSSEHIEFSDILLSKNKKLTDVALQIIKIVSNENTIPLNNLNGSLIHMMLNRIFKSKNRMNEFVCYDFLFRHYNSVIAMEKYKNVKI